MAANLIRTSYFVPRTSTVVLVTGGFHSTGIDKLLTDAGCAVITFVPKITKVDDGAGSAYLSVFSQEKTPLEKLFEGKKLFLAQEAFPRGVRAEAGVELGARALMNQTVPPAQVGPALAPLIGFASARIESVGSAEVKLAVQATANSRPAELTISADWVIRATVVRPLLENAALWAARLAAVWLWGFSTFTAVEGDFWIPILLGIVFSLAHPDLYRAPADGSSRLWHVFKLISIRAGLGWVFVALLASPYGVAKSLGAHILYNGIIAAARSAVQDLGWKNPVLIFIARLPLAMLGGSMESNVYTIESTNNVIKIVRGPVLKIDQTATAKEEVFEKIAPDKVEEEFNKISNFYDQMSASAVSDEDFFLLERIMNFQMVQMFMDLVKKRIKEHLEPAYVALRRACDELAEKPNIKSNPGHMDRVEAGRMLATAMEKSLKGAKSEPESDDPLKDLHHPGFWSCGTPTMKR